MKNRTWVYAIAVALVSLLIAGCAGGIVSPRPRMEGYLYYNQTTDEVVSYGSPQYEDDLLPLVNATVLTDTTTRIATTEGNGSFVLYGISSGHQQVQISHASFGTVTKDITVPQDPYPYFLRVTIALDDPVETTGTLEGYAFISDGSQLELSSQSETPQNYEALSGADVTVSKTNQPDGGTTTDSDGFFRIENLEAGTWDITVSSTALLEDYEGTVEIYVGETTRLEDTQAIKTGRGYYLIVGIDEYQYVGDGDGAVTNAERVYEVFHEGDHDMALSTRLLTNEDATFNAISDAIYDVMEKANPNDHFVIYFSGIGGGGLGPADDPDPDYFLPYDGDDADGSRAITDGELAEWLVTEEFAGTHVTVILDFDRSYYFMDGVATFPSDFQTLALDEHPLTTVITSGDGPSYSYDEYGGASVFTDALATALSTSSWPQVDEDGDGIIDSTELFDFIEEYMEESFNLIGINPGDDDYTKPSLYEYDDRPTNILRYE